MSTTLRQLLRPARDVVSVTSSHTLMQAFQRMREHAVSQLPVIEGGKVSGLIDESDILLHVYADPARFADTVNAAMVRKLDSLDIDAPIDALLPLFERGHIALVAADGQFSGLVTRSDLLAWLAAQG
ncbi:MAG: CBS domain-containing protein [Pseudomonadota bacterium]|nr:CBS domain-containing protein [Pseudomonadota bacterium]